MGYDVAYPGGIVSDIKSESVDETSPRKGGYSRSRHRTAAHDSAHADSTDHGLNEPPSHPLIPRGEVPLIQTDAAMTHLIAKLRAAGSFAYDSEFIGELSYLP